jgi:hypothetical protein
MQKFRFATRDNFYILSISLISFFPFFLIAQQHSITRFTPKTALTGQTVTITGTNFANITSVKFGGTDATSFSLINSTTITAIVATGNSGNLTVAKSGFSDASASGFVQIDSVVQLWSDYNGYWTSNSASNNTVFPDNNHNLLAFKTKGNTYSTGVSDATLTQNNVSYTAGDWKALPINNLQGSNTKAVIVYATYADGSVNCVNPNKTIIDVLIDGTKGLNLGTGVANFDAQMEFTVSSINSNKISDNIPDILITQVAEPSNALSDRYWFTNSSGNIIGDTVVAIVQSLPQLATYRLDVHQLTNSTTSNNNALTNGCSSQGNSNSTRPLRLLSLKLSDFNINSSNYSNVAYLKFTPSGIADYAFVAYNGESFTIPAPTVTSQPSSQIICTSSSNNVTFSVTANSSTTPAYQWKKNGNNISGATNSSYTITGVTSADAGAYVCEISNSAGTILSDPAYLNTYISVQPENKTICQNSSTTLSVTAEGNSPKYQWYSNTSNSNSGGTAISGATNATYSPPTNVSGIFYYYCIVEPSSSTPSCSTSIASNSVLVSISPTTVPGTLSGTANVCLPTNSTQLSLTGQTGTIQRWERSSSISFSSPTTISGASSSTYTATNVSSVSYYRVVVKSGVCDLDYSNITTITPITTYTWSGTTSDAFNVSSNWALGCVPPSGANISFTSNPTNICKLVSNYTLGTITISGSTTNHILDLNGYQLTVQGSLTFSGGKINAENPISTLIMNGSTSQSIPSGGLTQNVIANLTINNSNGVSINGPTILTRILTLTSGTLNTNDQLTFRSTASNTAMMAAVNYSNPINGKVIVEKFTSAKRSFRLISPSVTTSTSIKENWQEGANNTDTTLFNQNNKNPNPGYGTHIAGDKNGNNGFDATQTGNPSLFTFNNSTGVWSAINNTNTNTLIAGNPYRLMLRGDRSVNIHQPDNFPNPTNTVLRATGNLTTGNVNISGLNATASSTNFVGNPYQCMVDMTSLLNNSTNLNKNYYYAWDPDLNYRGGYTTINLSNNTNSQGSSATKYLQPQQAFFVATSSNPTSTPSLSFSENDKYTSSTTTDNFRKLNTDTNFLSIELYDVDRKLMTDATIIYFDNNYSNDFDDFDAIKLVNQDEMIASKINNRNIAIQYRNNPTEIAETIQLFANKYRGSNYKLNIRKNGLSNVSMELIDKFTNEQNKITNQLSYVFSINSELSSKDTNRFYINVVENTSLNSHSKETSKFTVYPNPTTANFTVNIPNIVTQQNAIFVYNALGKLILNLPISNYCFIDCSTWSQGVYTLKIFNQTEYLGSSSLIIQ